MALLDRFRTQKPLWEDPDPAIRAEAVRQMRAEEVELIRSIFRGDADPAVRRAALKKLSDVELWIETARGEADPSVREEAQALLLRLATESPDAEPALRAAASFSENRHLATLARSARVAAVREAALDRLTDEKTLAVVARTAEDARIRQDALARVVDPAARTEVALKSEHKDVALIALEGVSDDAALMEIALHARNKAAARRAHALCDARPSGARVAVAAAPAPFLDDETDEARAAREAREHARDVRLVLIEKVEALAAADFEAALADAEAAFSRVPPLQGPEADALRDRFLRAASRLRQEREQTEIEKKAAEQREQEGKQRERREQERAQRAQAEKQAREKLQEVCARVEVLAKGETLSLKDAERAMRDIRIALEDESPLVPKRDREHAAERLKAARAVLYPRLQELREADEWQRWANTSVQEELVARMEALVASPDLEKAALELHQLNERWRQFSQARKEEAATLWLRFKTAREALQARLDVFFKEKAAAEALNQAAKRALCEKAEALKSSTDWLKTAEAIKALQAEWKTIGPTPRKDQKAVWERFHAACDHFFTARKKDLEVKKDEWAKNLERKEALCAAAEALAGSTEWEKASADVRKLQADWKAIGPVRKNKSEAVWQRFHTACDRFFERYKKRGEIEEQANLEGRKTLCDEIEALCPQASDAPAPAELLPRVQDLAARFSKAPSVSSAEGHELHARFFAARDRLIAAWPASFAGSDLDPAGNRARREKLLAKIESVTKPFSDTPADESASLADRLREALATNSMGGRAVAEARWREAALEVESAQAAWQRVGPVPGEAGAQLQERFDRACQAFHAKKPRSIEALPRPDRGPRGRR